MKKNHRMNPAEMGRQLLEKIIGVNKLANIYDSDEDKRKRTNTTQYLYKY